MPLHLIHATLSVTFFAIWAMIGRFVIRQQ